ncbi:MAG: hypothetical protein ACSHX6_05170 [Akkermansiaceae bacterium]
MIHYPSKQFFRQQVIFGFIVWIAINVICYYNYDVKSIDEADLLSLNFYGSMIPPEHCWSISIAITVFYTVGILALIYFQGWGRILILVVLGIECFLSPFMGMIVDTGSMDMLSTIADVLIGVPWVLSFFEPCSSYFDPPHRSNLLKRKSVHEP